mgnify:CR=1 FL=1
MLTDQELQSLRNLGNQCERAASEIYSLRAALTQKRAEYEDLKQTMHNMARNHALQLEAARKHEPESVPELRAQLQRVNVPLRLPRWMAEWIAEQCAEGPPYKTATQLIEAAMVKAYKLRPPKE